MESTSQPRAKGFVTGGAYALLFVFGAVQALLGCFQYSQTVGAFPLVALGFCALILVTCLLGGIGMGSLLGAVLPAIGWFAVSFVFTLPTSGGSVIVANVPAGKWFLYGGAVCACAAVVITMAARARRTGRNA